MGVLGDTIREVLNRGLRAMNYEINRDALEKGLIQPIKPEESATPHTHCRAGFEKLHATLTADRH